MTKADEIELFAFLSRQHKLREWLNDKVTSDIEVLVGAGDIEQLRRAQGRAGLLKTMLRLLDEAPAALKSGTP